MIYSKKTLGENKAATTGEGSRRLVLTQVAAFGEQPEAGTELFEALQWVLEEVVRTGRPVKIEVRVPPKT